MATEYRNVNDGNRSRVTVLASALPLRPAGIYGKARLIHGTAGFECAGSMARETGEYWAVQMDYTSGGTGGKRFLSIAPAQAYYEQVTGEQYLTPEQQAEIADQLTGLSEAHTERDQLAWSESNIGRRW